MIGHYVAVSGGGSTGDSAGGSTGGSTEGSAGGSVARSEGGCKGDKCERQNKHK